MSRIFVRCAFTFVAIAILAIVAVPATPAAGGFQISSPHPNTVVSSQVIEISGGGADPGGTIVVELLTNDWYPQTGKCRVNSDGSWSYGPVFLSGQGPYNNHSIRATIVKDGRRGKSVTVAGIVRKQ